MILQGSDNALQRHGAKKIYWRVERAHIELVHTMKHPPYIQESSYIGLHWIGYIPHIHPALESLEAYLNARLTGAETSRCKALGASDLKYKDHT